MIQDNLQLFDEMVREYLGPSKYSEPHWQFLNRSARAVFQYIREVLDGWFRNYEAPPDKRHHLWTDFRSDRDTKHLSAFFELYLYHLFKNQGFDVKVEPEWEQGRPDFLLTSAEGKEILLEATGIYPERWFGEAKKLEQKVIDYLDENLDSPDFFLHIRIANAPDDPPPYAQMQRYLQKKLAQLDYDQVLQDALGREGMGLNRFPSIPWVHDTWTIEFIAIPKRNDARGKTGVRPTGSMFYDFTWVDSTPSLKACIDSKYGHYGDLRIPYILAINVVDPFADEESLLDALFGQEVWNLDLETDKTFVSRQPNGAWFGPNGPQKKRVSGICVFWRLRPENMHTVNPMIWHHPSANYPLDPELVRLPQQIPNRPKGFYELRRGVRPATLLQLDETKMPVIG